MTPDDQMRDGKPHKRVFMATFAGGTSILVSEWWDEDGTVDRSVSLRPIHGDYCQPVDLHQVVP